MRLQPVAVMLLGLCGSLSIAAQVAPPAKDVLPNPDAAGVYRVREGVVAPKLVFSVEPESSEKTGKKKVGGNCRVGITVDTTGLVKDVHVVHSIAEDQPPKLRAAAVSLDEEAMKAVRQYRFEPGTFQGKPVPVALTVEVNFHFF